MYTSIKRILSVLFVFMLLLPMAAIAEDASEEAEAVYVLDYFSDTALDLTQYEGKAVYMNFFTEWCPYCMDEMPDIREIYDTYDPDSLEIILVHPWDGEDASNTASVVETYGLEGMTTFEDEDMTITAIVGVPGYPTSVFIDQDGYLFYAIASKLEYDSLAEIIDAMGVPKREEAESDAESTPVPASLVPDAMAEAASGN